MLFVILILLTAFLMEGVGSYISVVGLSALFSGDWVIIAMAVILDIAKVTTVSFLYQYWGEVKKSMRAYMTAAVIVLMTITSAGAFGYLSGAFQKAVQPNREIALKVDSLTREMTALEAEKKELTDTKLKINAQIANVPTSTEDTARRRLISSFKPELDRSSKRLEVVSKRVDELRGEVLRAQSENIEKDVHTGPITYVAKAFNLSLEDASKYIILLIVLVFDPLAVMLVLAGNFLIVRRSEHPEPAKDEQVAPPMPSALHETPSRWFPSTEWYKKKVLEPSWDDVDEPTVIGPPGPMPEPEHTVQPPAEPEANLTPPDAVVLPEIPLDDVVEELVAAGATDEEVDQVAAELIAEPPARSVLADLRVGLEDALFQHGVPAVSRKREQYEGLASARTTNSQARS